MERCVGQKTYRLSFWIPWIIATQLRCVVRTQYYPIAVSFSAWSLLLAPLLVAFTVCGIVVLEFGASLYPCCGHHHHQQQRRRVQSRRRHRLPHRYPVSLLHLIRPAPCQAPTRIQGKLWVSACFWLEGCLSIICTGAPVLHNPSPMYIHHTKHGTGATPVARDSFTYINLAHFSQY